MDAILHAGLRILLVEDNEAILKALGRLLNYLGHSVTECRSAFEAASILEVEDVDLLISDLHLGSGSGLELIRQVRQTSEVPAIAMSGQFDMAESCLAVGFTAFLEKPVSRHRLQEAIDLIIATGTIAGVGAEILTPGFVRCG